MSRARSAGTSAETAIVNVLQPLFPSCERRALNGAKDRGDITGVHSKLVVEAKAAKRVELAQWLKETDAEVVNANAEIGVCWFKLRGSTDPLHWPVVMRGRFFLPLLQAWCER